MLRGTQLGLAASMAEAGIDASVPAAGEPNYYATLVLVTAE